jgi:ATP-dependent RNA helicase DHX8/PRP22
MVIYHEVVLSTKEYMRNCMAVDAKWLVEVAPRHFRPADPTRLSLAKKRVKIEPLFDKFAPPDAWRLSKRMG